VRIESVEHGNQLLSQALASAIRIQYKPQDGMWVPPRLVIEVGITTETLQLKMNKWRWTWSSVYGNGSGVYGEGCDGSGFVITDVDLLNQIKAFEQAT